MSGKRKREDDDFEFTPPSIKLTKAQREEVTRSGRARKKPARFLDEDIEDDIDKIDSEDEEDEEETPIEPVKSGKPQIMKSPPTQRLLMQTLQTEQKPMTILTQQKVQPIQIQIPASSLLQSVAAQQGLRVVSPTTPQLQIISPPAPQIKIVTQMAPQVMQQIVPQSVIQTPQTPIDNSDAAKRGRVRKKSAKVIEMEEFEEAEKVKPKKGTGKQLSPVVSPPVLQSPPKLPPTGITIIRNEQGQNVVLSVAGGIPNIIKAEPAPSSAKKSKAKEKSKDQVILDESQDLLVKKEPSDGLALTPGLPSSARKQKPIKVEPTTKKQQVEESPPSPTKKGKSVIKMLLNTPTQFITPTVSTTAISSDKAKETTVEMVKSEPAGERTVKKIVQVMSPSDLDDSRLSFDDDDDEDDFDDDLEDDDDEGDDEDDMDWQFDTQDGSLLDQDELRKRKEISPTDLKKGKKKATKKKSSHEDDDLDEDDDDDDDDDFGDDDDDDDEGNLVIADEVTKKKKPTKKASSKKKADSSKAGKADKPAKEKKKKRLTAYTMWCNSMRNKVLLESPGIDFAQLSKRLGEIWQGLPSRDKMSWKRKAKREARKLMGKGLLIRTGKAAATTPAPSTAVQQKSSVAPKSVPPIHHTPITHHRTAVTVQKMEEHAIQLRGSGIEPIDVAAYLKLVGESLSIIGMRLQEHRGLIAVQGSLSVLLDSLLCALGPLMCLTTQIPELHGCPAETHNRTLDNLAYFMPGL